MALNFRKEIRAELLEVLCFKDIVSQSLKDSLIRGFAARWREKGDKSLFNGLVHADPLPDHSLSWLVRDAAKLLGLSVHNLLGIAQTTCLNHVLGGCQKGKRCKLSHDNVNLERTMLAHLDAIQNAAAAKKVKHFNPFLLAVGEVAKGILDEFQWEEFKKVDLPTLKAELGQPELNWSQWKPQQLARLGRVLGLKHPTAARLTVYFDARQPTIGKKKLRSLLPGAAS